MAHTRGGGIGNLPGSDDRTIDELILELRQRIAEDKYQSYCEISSDELDRLVDAITNARNEAAAEARDTAYANADCEPRS